MRSAFVLFSAAISSLVLAVVAEAQVSLAYKCLSPDGKLFTGASSLVSGADVGWSDDAITDGVFIISVDEIDGSIVADVRFKDATGVMRSARSQGAAVGVGYVDSGNGVLRVDLTYPDGTVEIFSLQGINAESQSVIYTKVRVGNLFNSSGIYTASCSLM